MTMVYELTAAEAGVTTAEAKAWARIDDDVEDAVIAIMALAATSECEHRLQREVIYRSDPQALSKVFGAVPSDVKAWICARITAMFDERNAETPTAWQRAPHYEHLLDRYVLHDREPDSDFEASDESEASE